MNVMAKAKYDEVLLGILKEEAHLYPFLDVIFGFLYRCTDFYVVQRCSDDKLGFPVGVAQNIITNVYKKWEAVAVKDKEYHEHQRVSQDVCPPAVHEVVVKTQVNKEESVKGVIENSEPSTQQEENKRDVQRSFQSSDSSYNGAVRDGYQWSQTISDIDVQVTVPPHITKARDVQVDVSSSHVSVKVLKERTREWQLIFGGDLCHHTNKDESVWSLVSGRCVQIHLEKHKERWWDALFTSEDKIDLQQIDASRPMDDLSQEEQMKIQELVWNQERKRQGLPTSENMALETMLKEAWNKEGSPFSGRPYNPKEFNFGDNTIEIQDHKENT